MTKLIYMDDSYAQECDAKVEGVVEYNDEGDDSHLVGIILDSTVFYPRGGGQPCDTGKLIDLKTNEEFNVVQVKKENGKVVHYVDKIGLKIGDTVHCKIDWERRYTFMRYHTASHVIAGMFNSDTGAQITGNQIGLDKTRFDFSLENFDKSLLEKEVEKANSYFGTDVPVSIFYMPRDEALNIPGMVKLANALPPNIETLRIVKIGTDDNIIDIQADGGTHVNNLKEVPKVEIIKLENKGKNNKRVYFRFVEQN
ncbi:alanyl-tRNA editing protein [Candidatus Micrarchaeota archaeon]|nr:alanyl-tRNA editing protein [Candidatus Micrarchaeota archaeon]